MLNNQYAPNSELRLLTRVYGTSTELEKDEAKSKDYFNFTPLQKNQMTLQSHGFQNGSKKSILQATLTTVFTLQDLLACTNMEFRKKNYPELKWT